MCAIFLIRICNRCIYFLETKRINSNWSIVSRCVEDAGLYFGSSKFCFGSVKVLFSLGTGPSEVRDGGGTGHVCLCWSLNFPSVVFAVPVGPPVGYTDLDLQERGWMTNQLLLIIRCGSVAHVWWLQSQPWMLLPSRERGWEESKGVVLQNVHTFTEGRKSF